ncbi:FAD dependent oxidoreductase [Rhypophila decipiens]|uniref:FAD dependent oxidoreductase n=1 Tax=Rhypophila decipiens TaxID=261697 RepID=A0AAN6YIK8_9PEZI|nr:FAD dependent oxidoreductase [Rhypophila decipiens]
MATSNIACSSVQAQSPPAISVFREGGQIHSGRDADSDSDPNSTSVPAGLPSANPTKSYWLQNLSPVLEGHRTTPELPAEADVVVVGSGITGAFAAWFLKMGVDSGLDDGLEAEEDDDLYKRKRETQTVVMLEAREACSGATGRNGGHCQPQVYSISPTSAEFELGTYHFLEKLIKKYDIPCDWVSQSGVHAFLSQDVFDFAKDSVEDLETTHPHLAAQVTVICPNKTDPQSPDAQAKNIKPQPKQTLSSLRIPHAKGAIIQQHAASLWPYKLVSWLLEHLLSKFTSDEFNLQTNTPVTSLRRASRSDIPTTTDGNKRQWLLSTPRGTILANKVILATNGYTSHLLPKMSDLIVPVRGQVAALVPPAFSQSTTQEEEIAKLEHTYLYVASEPGEEGHNTKEDYLIQRPIRSGEQTKRGPGEYIFGGGRDFASSPAYGLGEWRDDSIDRDVSTYLRGHLSPPLDLRPDIPNNDEEDTINDKSLTQGLEASYQWTGVMGFTRDGHPLVGPVPASLVPDADSNNYGTLNENEAARAEQGKGGAMGDGEGVWICAGYNGHGMPVAALSARAIVEQVLGLSSPSSRRRGAEALPREFYFTEERVKLT